MAKTRNPDPKNPDPRNVPLSAVLHALSDPVRLKIVRLAARGERACCDFGLELSKATASHHFKVLREAGVVRQRACGTQRLTSLRRDDLDARFPGLLAAVLRTPEDE